MPSEEIVRHYRDKGWAKLPQIVDAAELAGIRAAFEDARDRPEFATKKTGFQADQAQPEFAEVLRIYRSLWKAYPAVEAVCRRLGPVARELNGWRGARLWADRVFVKPGRDSGSRPTIWHQDSPKAPFDRRGFATFWIALQDVPLQRGAMVFLDRSHRLGPLGAIDQLGPDRDLSEILQPEDWEIVGGCSTAAPLQAGDATMHQGMLLHRAHANTDKEDRVILVISYFDADARWTGAESQVMDGLGLVPYQPVDHPNFPLVAGEQRPAA